MRPVPEELGSAQSQIERLSREVARLRQELDAAKQGAADQGITVDTPRDSGERQRVERELRESERRFRELFDLLPASISFTRKSDHVFLEVNRGFEVGSGMRREDVIGRSARHLALWASTEERDKLLHLLDTQGDIRNHEMRVMTANGRRLQMSFSASRSASVTPMTMAGRASGSATRKNTSPLPAPSTRAASSAAAFCIRKEARAAR